MTRIIDVHSLDDVATGRQTGTVGEPSLASSGRRTMITGNWYASRTFDGGNTWSLLDPFTSFPSAARGFCCDQLVHYCRSRRMWIWLLQYSAIDGANIFRLAMSHSGTPGTWNWWDVAPTDIDPSWTNEWFDYPDMAESDDQLWISFNMFDEENRWQRAIVLTFPLDEIKARGELTRRTWTTTSTGSLRFTQGLDDSMWFAGQSSDNRGVRLFNWPDGSATVSGWTVPVRPWNSTGYSSLGPGGREWMARTDDRITAAWRSNGQLGFAWAASSEAGRPHPYIRVVRIDEATLELIDEPDLWSSTGAYAYPAAGPNRRGDIGLAAFYGGGTRHPSHIVAHFDDSTRRWNPRIVASSTHGPDRGKWGDYIEVRPDPRRSTYWIASGFTLQGGTDRRNVEPHIVTFAP